MEYLNHSESKFDGDVGILERKHVNVTGIIHIGKESNELEESELLSVDAGSYEIYENVKNLDSRFEKIAFRVLELKPRYVKKFGISKQTLWNVKLKIKSHKFNSISITIKIIFLQVFQTL